MSEFAELMNKIQMLYGQITQLRAENERLKRDLESAYEKINILELNNPIQLFTPDFVCTKCIMSRNGSEHELKKGAKKTSI